MTAPRRDAAGAQTSGSSPRQELPARFASLLRRCVEQDASDIHLAEGLPPYLRSQGPLEIVSGEAPLDRALPWWRLSSI